MRRFEKVAIIGLGLIGGSIAKRLKTMHPERPIASMKKEGCVDILFESWEELVQWSDLIVLATPIGVVVPLARIIKEAHRTRPVVVIDVGSVKRKICREFERLSEGAIEFLGTHPMAGKELSGWEASEAELFQGAPWIIAPHGRNSDGVQEAVIAWVRMLGAHEKVLSAEEHDRKVAFISHFPKVVSEALLAFVRKQEPEALELAGPGFLSMTRLAGDNPEMHAEIARHNGDHVQEAMKKWVEYLLEGTR
ncbi:MAG: prephenate dehydrogenase/arogenate dehydrogenase family protein [Chlamydiota bacterium]